MPPFTLHGNSIELSGDGSSSQVHRSAAKTNYILLQTTHHPDGVETQKLSDLGARILTIEEETSEGLTYLCRFEPTDLKPLRDLSFVRGAFVYHNDLVVDPMLLETEPSHVHQQPIGTVNPVESTSTRNGTAPSTNSTTQGEDLSVEVIITLHASSPETGSDVLSRLQAICHSPPNPGLRAIARDEHLLHAWVPQSALREVASLDYVAGIHPAYRREPRAIKARKCMGLDTVNGLNGPPAVQRYQGREQIVAVADSGLDLGLFAQAEPSDEWAEYYVETRVKEQNDALEPASQEEIDAVKRKFTRPYLIAGFTETGSDGHPVSRIVNTTNSGLSDTTGHGTHVAGCIAANYEWSPSPGVTRKVTGSAPAAKLFIMRWGGDGTTAVQRLTAAHQNGARIVNMSVASGDQVAKRIQLQYNPNGLELDNAVSQRPNVLIVLAAGNHGDILKAERETQADVQVPAGGGRPPDTEWNKQIGAESAAKNILVVGATWTGRFMAASPLEPGPNDPTRVAYPCNDRKCLEDVNPRPGNGVTFAADAVAAFSEKGPTREGLLKPDVVAPGVGILGMRSRFSPDSKDTTDNETGFSLDPSLWWGSGTSMAAPFVSGLAACIREAIQERCGPDHEILACTLRAIIVNAAQSLKGKPYWLAKTIWRDKVLVPDTFSYWQESLGSPPDCVQGFGRVSYPRSIKHVLDNLPETSLEGEVHFQGLHSGFSQCQDGIGNGQTEEFQIYPGAVQGYFTATLAYDDVPHQLLQSVLDLSIKLYSVDKNTGEKSLIGAEIKQRPVNMLTYPLPPGPGVRLGTVRKAYWPKPLTPLGGAKELLVVIKVLATRVVPANKSVRFTVAWLTDDSE